MFEDIAVFWCLWLQSKLHRKCGLLETKEKSNSTVTSDGVTVNLFPTSDSFIFKCRTTVPWLSTQRVFWAGQDNTCAFCCVWENVAFMKTDTCRLLWNNPWVSSLMALPSGALVVSRRKGIYLQSWRHSSTLTHRNDSCAAGQWLSYYDAIHHNHTSLMPLCWSLCLYTQIRCVVCHFAKVSICIIKKKAIWLGVGLGDMLFIFIWI